MKKGLLFVSLLSIISLIGCSKSPSESDKSDKENESNESTEVDSSESESASGFFNQIAEEEDVTFYHDQGGFIFTVGYHKYGSLTHTLDFVDYSLGEYSQGYSGGVISNDGESISFDDVKVQLQRGVASEFFSTSGDKVEISRNASNGAFSAKIGEKTYNLSIEEVARKYYLNPSLVGKWENKDNNFSLEIKKDKNGESLNLFEGENELDVSAFTHDANGSTFTILEDGDLFKNNKTATIYDDENTGDIFLKYENTDYPLSEVIETQDGVIEGLFTFDNMPNGTILSNGDLTLTAATPMGDVARWFKLKEGETSKDTRWQLTQNGSIATYTCDIAGKDGLIKEGITYTMYGKMIDNNEVIYMDGSDGSSITLTRS